MLVHRKGLVSYSSTSEPLLVLTQERVVFWSPSDSPWLDLAHMKKLTSYLIPGIALLVLPHRKGLASYAPPGIQWSALAHRKGWILIFPWSMTCADSQKELITCYPSGDQLLALIHRKVMPALIPWLEDINILIKEISEKSRAIILCEKKIGTIHSEINKTKMSTFTTHVQLVLVTLVLPITQGKQNEFK